MMSHLSPPYEHPTHVPQPHISKCVKLLFFTFQAFFYFSVFFRLLESEESKESKESAKRLQSSKSTDFRV